MTVRLSHKARPPFPFSTRARINELACLPRSYVRAHDPGGRALYAPMLAWSDGPVAIGATGDNSLASLTDGTWLLQVCLDGSWVIYRAEGDGLIVETFDDPPDPVGPEARHISLAFDQSARIALAWEEEEVIRVRRWDATAGEYIENVSFSGVDPCLVLDATLARYVPGSDVLLFYLSTDRERVCCRVQRDVYAVEYELWDYETPVVLDRALALPWRYELLVSDEHGDPLPNMLISAIYPYRARVDLAGDGEVFEGEYLEVAQEYRHDITIAGDAIVFEGIYDQVVTQYAHLLPLVGDGVIHEGVYDQVVTQYMQMIAVDGDGNVESGEYVGPAFQLMHGIGVVGDAVIQGGAYEAA